MRRFFYQKVKMDDLNALQENKQNVFGISSSYHELLIDFAADPCLDLCVAKFIGSKLNVVAFQPTTHQGDMSVLVTSFTKEPTDKNNFADTWFENCRCFNRKEALVRKMKKSFNISSKDWLRLATTGL
jgi:hypothetical protein